MKIEYRVKLLYGGHINCAKVTEAKTGKSLILSLGTCDCYKSSCDCVTELVIPKKVVLSWDAALLPKTQEVSP